MVTPLHDLHRALGGRMVDFAGWDLPIQYEGVVAEHTWCRASAGLFDVSHMGVLELRGDDVATSLERLTPAAIATLGSGRMRYGLLTNTAGGIIDDFMVSNLDDHLMMVINASRRSVDVPHLRAHLAGIDLVERADLSLIALQGPKAITALQRLQSDVSQLCFLDVARMDLRDPAGSDRSAVAAVVSRSGYTGEDGFELALPADRAEAVARWLLAQPEVKPCGLGARDTLRLEAGLCLYGNDLDDTTTPIEADLVWTMPKLRREAGDFIGAGPVLAQLADGPSRIRVGLAAEGRRPVRDHTLLRASDGTDAGAVTSGGYGPSLERPVAMGYVPTALALPGTRLVADVRGTDVIVTVADLPFTPHRYVRRPV